MRARGIRSPDEWDAVVLTLRCSRRYAARKHREYVVRDVVAPWWREGLDVGADVAACSMAAPDIHRVGELGHSRKRDRTGPWPKGCRPDSRDWALETRSSASQPN
jgi:hypothetical protein